MKGHNLKEQEVISFVIVLGLKLKEVSKDKFEMENVLLDRLELANRLFQSIYLEEKIEIGNIASKSCIILSGRGQTGNESHTMRDYLKRIYKYSDANLLAEDNSMTTVENFIFSFFQIWKSYENVYKGKKFNFSIVTSDYHKERTKHICETFIPLIRKAFINNSIQSISYYGSITNTTEQEYLWKLSQKQVDEFLHPNFQWSQFAQFRFLKNYDQQMFLQYSKLFKQ